MIISIIIPVYNVERYLRKCMDSVCSQTCDKADYEVIVVNDGSPDNSLGIAKEYEAKYCNVTVVTQENQGLSGARNTGARLAKGDYLWFVDSDDWIRGDSVATLKRILEQTHPDLLCMNVAEIDERTNEQIRITKATYRRGSDHLYGKVLKDIDYNYYIHTGVSPKNLYRRNWFVENNLFFMPGVIHEDEEQSLRAFIACKSAYLLDEPLYYYLRRESGSITTARSIRSIQSCITFVERWWKMKNEAKLDRRQQSMLHARVFDNVYKTFSSERLYDEAEYNNVLCGHRKRLYKMAVVSMFKTKGYMTAGRLLRYTLLFVSPRLCKYHR